MSEDKQTAQELIETLRQISNRLGLDGPLNSVSSEPQNIASLQYQDGIWGRGGICSGHIVKPLPKRYFIAQEFGSESGDLRKSVEKAFTDFGVESIRADDQYWGGPLLCKICSLIQGTPFGVYQLSVSQNRNVYLELGIAMGLGKPFVLVKDRAAIVAELIRGLEYYSINSYLETEFELGALARQYITGILKYQPQKLPQRGALNTVVIALGELEQVDIGVTIAKVITHLGFTPVFLGKIDDKVGVYLRHQRIHYEYSRTRDEIVKAIQAAKFGVYRVDKAASPDAFIMLGVAIGLNRPFVLISNLNGNRQDGIPTDIEGLQNIQFQGFVHLEETLMVELPQWLEKVRV